MTKIMMWNIENFDINKITSATQALYAGWGTLLKTYLATTPAATPLAFLQQATTNFPAQSTDPQYLVYYAAVLNSAVALAITATAGAVAYETTFTTALTTAMTAPTFPTPPKWPQAAFTNGLTAIAASGTVEEVLYKIFENFFTTTCGSSNLLLMLANSILLQTTPNLKAELSEITREIVRQGATSTELYVRNHIAANINPGGGTPLPDILVVIEVISGTAVAQYQAIDGAGESGVMALLTILRTLNPNYCLVPPVRMGNTGNDKESIAIFYNANTLQFQGPLVWNGTNAVAPTTTTVPAGYGGNWQPVAYPVTPPAAPGVIAGNALPDRGVTIGPVTCREYELAGQCIFTNAGTALDFMVAGFRPPLVTDFVEIAGGRVIRLCSMHPNRGALGSGNAPNSVANLGNIIEMSAASITGVGVILGDFNTQLLNAPTKTISYTALTGTQPYRLVFDDTFSTLPERLTTTLSDLGANTLANAFPGYGYFKKLNLGGGVSIYESLDNILLTPPATVYTDAMILNRVVGVSLANASNNLSSPTNQTTYGYDVTNSILTTGPAASPYGCLMGDTIQSIVISPATTTVPSRSTAFNGIENYGKIRATSDHMALIITI